LTRSGNGSAGSSVCCPDTDRHRGFYERLGFVLVARLPRYYHGRDFLEYVREPLPRGYEEPGAR
jgi:hypothetical protein